MRKLLFIVFCIAMSLIFSVSCQGFEFKNPPIVDNAGYLTQSEYDEISTLLEEFRLQNDFDLVIYTENKMSGASAQSTADDIFDYMGYGASDESGMILYICADTREYHFSTFKKGTEYFNDNRLRRLDEQVLPHLSEGDYYGAFCAYIETAEEIIKDAKSKVFPIFCIIGGGVIIPLIIAFIMMFIKLGKMKTAVKNNYAKSYIKPGSININISKDLFLFSRVTKIKKQNSNSTTHTSSSGRSHGGRGGSF